MYRSGTCRSRAVHSQQRTADGQPSVQRAAAAAPGWAHLSGVGAFG